MNLTTAVKIGMATVAVLILISIASCSTQTVDSGKQGVVVTYGKATSTVGEGLHFVNPFGTRIVEMSTRQIPWNSETVAYTKDVQQAEIAFTVTYSISPDKVLWIYKNVGENWANQIVPQVAEQSIKDVFGQSEAVKDAINNRAAVQARIKAILTAALAARNVQVHGFELRNISFSEAFEDAVEAKQVAIEKANAAKNRTVEIEENARQKIIIAQAEAESMRIQSEALSTNQNLVQWEAVKKWQGWMCPPDAQTCIIGQTSGVTPFLNVN